MKLATSSGDFVRYSNSIAQAVKAFQNTKFKYINLELDYYYEEWNLTWQEAVDVYVEAAEQAGVIYSTAHSPILNAFAGDEEHYNHCVKIIRDSIEIAGTLGITGTVIHASHHPDFTAQDFYRENKRFYSAFFDLAEKYNIQIMTENMATYTTTPLSTGREMREFAEYVDHPLFGVCWDTAHANLNTRARPQGQYQGIVDVGDKLMGLHIADNFGDGPHHHTWPFAGIINFDSVMQGLLDIDYKGFFTFEASYTLLHHLNLPYKRQPWEHNGETVTTLLDPPLELKKQAVDLMYEVGKHILETYNCFEV